MLKACTICTLAVVFAVRTESSVKVYSVSSGITVDLPEVYTTGEVNGLIAGLRTELNNLGPRLSTELTNKLNKDLDEFNVRVLVALNQGKPVAYLRSEAQIKEEVRKEVQAQYSKRLTDLEARVAALEKRPK